MNNQDFCQDYYTKLSNEFKNQSDFSYFGDLDLMDENNKWIVVFGKHRDSDILAISNYECFLNSLLEINKDDISEFSCNHWAVGYVEYIAIKALDEKGEFTEVFKNAVEMLCSLEDYPVLDEEDFSSKEFEQYLEYAEDNFSDIERLIYNNVEEYPRLKVFFNPEKDIDTNELIYDDMTIDITENQRKKLLQIIIEQCEYYGECYFKNEKILDDILEDENYKYFRENSNNPEYYINPDQLNLF